MGGYDFRPARVLKTAKQLFAVGRISREPAWVQTVGENPPPQILVRTQPVQHAGYGKQRPTRKLKKQFLPQKISYPEDKMRGTFFRDHPWELARPRILLEGNKVDGGENWGKVRPQGLGLQPENVIRRQLWLIEHEKQDPQTAYDTARREFYQERFREDIERKVAKEEALHSGAYFAKSTIAWGMELEDRKFYGFKQWASRISVRRENLRQSQLYGGDEAALESQDGAAGGMDAEAAAQELIEQDEPEPESETTSKPTPRSAQRRAPQPVSGFDLPEEEDNGGSSLRI